MPIKYSCKEHQQLLLLCTPQTMQSIPKRLLCKYARLAAKSLRLIWSTQAKSSHPQNLHINPYFKENT